MSTAIQTPVKFTCDLPSIGVKKGDQGYVVYRPQRSCTVQHVVGRKLQEDEVSTAHIEFSYGKHTVAIAEIVYDFTLCISCRFAGRDSREIFHMLYEHAEKFEAGFTQEMDDRQEYMERVVEYFKQHILPLLPEMGEMEDECPAQYRRQDNFPS